LTRAIDGVIFDLDGTLVQFNIDYASIRADIIHRLVQMGFPRSDFSLEDGMFRTIEKAQQGASKVGGISTEEVRKIVFAIADEHEMASTPETKIILGVRMALRKLKKAGFRLAICTIRGSKATRLLLSKLKIDDFFEVVVTRDEAPKVKPHPSHIGLALELLGVPASRVVLVGDGKSDIEMARSAGVLSVGVGSGLSTRSELEALGADYTIDSVRDLPALMRSILEG
jgi:phosphoglycolate phosphatase